jgi:hypothetical protein
MGEFRDDSVMLLFWVTYLYEYNFQTIVDTQNSPTKSQTSDESLGSDRSELKIHSRNEYIPVSQRITGFVVPAQKAV